ncbi:MAG: AbrB/MazE/SpoVT family DNA-binding domain-containing protein [bacterium]|nr:AbrB/MazE/SpoVT family DNA-binding domain-containing protein [bacterium]
MTRAKITSKGQVTIPAVVRRRMDLKPGDYLEFHLEQEMEVTIRPFRVRAIPELYGSLPATRTYPGDEAIKKEVAEAIARYRLEKGREE